MVRLLGFMTLGNMGVKVFFAISGFLITKSLFRQPSLGSFVWARFLRIFPGLFLTAIFCAFIIGPLCTTLPLSKYFTSIAVYDFTWRLATLHNFSNALPGTFKTNPYPGSVNSPIWTLPAELLMYLCVLLLGVLLLLVKKQFGKLLIALPVLIVVFVFFWGIPYEAWYISYIFSWSTLFFLGACCYLFRNKIIISLPLLLGTFIVFYAWFHFRLPYIDYVVDMPLVYGILVFSYHPKLQVKSFHKLGDFSYGLYIYAFPVQQLLTLKFPALTPTAHFFYTFPLVLLLAVLSWYFAEKPMLKLKTTTLFKR